MDAPLTARQYAALVLTVLMVSLAIAGAILDVRAGRVTPSIFVPEDAPR